MSKIYFFITVLIIASSANVFAQTKPVDFKPVSVPSPNTASLGKYGEIPVSYYSGTPNVSIPLHSIEVGDINLPLTLSYHTSGIKVEELSSWIGLGWSMSAGGMITTETRGIEDTRTGSDLSVIPGMIDRALGASLYSPYSWAPMLLDELSMGTDDDKLKLREIMHGSIDGESDLYYVNCAGLSAKFFQNNNGDFMIAPHVDLDISYDEQEMIWTVVDAKGITYEFVEREFSHADAAGMPTTTAWWINEIRDSNGNTIQFHYSQYLSHAYTMSQSGYSYVESDGSYQNPQISEQLIFDHSLLTLQRLEKITASNGIEVNFYASESRQDQEYEHSLDSIYFLNSSGSVFKRVYFDHSYFQGIESSPHPFETQTFPNSDSFKRFKLDGVTIDAAKYSFNYDNTPLPTRYSIDQDLWGYYNAAGNSKFNPSYTELLPNGKYLTLDGGNRIVNPQVIGAGTLQKIIYPTGGRTEFTFEPNEVRDKLVNGIPASVILQHEHLVEVKAVTGSCLSSVYTSDIDYSVGSLPLNFSFVAVVTPPNANWKDYLYIELVDANTLGAEYAQPLSVDGGQIPPGAQPPPGHYKVRLCGALGTYYIKVDVTWQRPSLDLTNGDQMVNKAVGGLRVKSIANYADDVSTPQVLSYTYTLDNDPQASSGGVINYPINFRDYFTISFINGNAGSGAVCIFEKKGEAHFKMCTSYSMIPLALNGDSYVGYSTVREQIGTDGAGGENIYYFTNVNTDKDWKLDPDYDFPKTPYTSLNWFRGLLLEKKVFKKAGGQNIEVERTLNYYTKVSTWFDTNRRCLSIKTGGLYEIQTRSGSVECPPIAVDNIAMWRPYVTVSGWSQLDSSVTRTYENGVFLKQTAMYKYSNPYYSKGYYSVIEEEKLQSNGGATKVTYRYPLDFDNVTAADDESQGVKSLQDKHILNALVEKSTFRKRKVSDDYQLISSSYNGYFPSNALMKSVFEIENDEGITDFAASAIASGAISKDPRYRLKIAYNKYTPHGKLLEAQRVNDIPVSYRWSQDQELLAETVNAASNEIEAVDFEEDGNSLVGDAHTGNYSSTNGYQLSLTNLSPGKSYRLTYWKKVNNEWAKVEQSISLDAVTTQFSLQIQGQLDDLRFYPKGAQMITYTHLQGYGISSISDPNDLTTYYEYNSFGRLNMIRDHDKNIMKHYKYHYKEGIQDVNYIRSIDVKVTDQTDVNEIEGSDVNKRLVKYDFLDGLGRPSQTVSMQSSPSGMDIVQPFVYDAFGREAVRYLPYAATEDNGWYKANPLGTNDYNNSPQKDFYNNGSTTIAQDAAPYAQTEFEASPLNRVLKQGAPGVAGQPNAVPASDHSVKKEYGFNGEEEVILFDYDEATASIHFIENGTLKYYDPNQLYANKTVDENNHEVIEYVDKEGRTLLKKVQYEEISGVKHYTQTYYIYDDLGNLRVVLPPEASATLTDQQ